MRSALPPEQGVPALSSELILPGRSSEPKGQGLMICIPYVLAPSGLSSSAVSECVVGQTWTRFRTERQNPRQGSVFVVIIVVLKLKHD